MASYFIIAFNGTEAKITNLGGISEDPKEAMKEFIQNIGVSFHKEFYEGLRLTITLHKQIPENKFIGEWQF